MEERELENAMKKHDDKANQAESAKINEEVDGKQSRTAADDEYEKMTLASNTDRDDSVIEASSVDVAIARMTVTDNCPEWRLKASFEAFEEAKLPVLKQEKPGLTHTQYKDILSELWKKSPDNPLDQENQTLQKAEWSLLPKDLLEQISSYLHTSIDLLRFRSVCSSWRSSVLPNPPPSSTSFRFVLNDQNNRILGASFGFYLNKRTIFLIKSPTSPDCWLVKIEEDSSNKIHLLNPLSRYSLNSFPRSFPRSLDLSNFRIFELGQEYVLHHASSRTLPDAGNLYMEKVVITWLNGGSHFLLLTIHVSGRLAMFRSVDKEWTIIREMPSPYDDVIVYSEQFYAVDNTGRTVHVGSNAELKLIANPVFGGDKKYLVESKGQLLLVDMYLSIDTADQSGIGEEFLEHLALYMNERTVRFKVFKLDEETQSWGAVSCLDDLVLFLGEDSSFSASAADLSGCSGNCIFFVDNYPRNQNTTEEEDGVLVGGDIGVFDLGSASIGPLSSYPQYSKMFWPPPAWVSNTSLEIKE